MRSFDIWMDSDTYTSNERISHDATLKPHTWLLAISRSPQADRFTLRSEILDMRV